MDNFYYGYKLPHGIILLYGDNAYICREYIDKIADSVENVCAYCQTHNIKIIHATKYTFCGLIEHFNVNSLLKKYSVKGEYSEIQRRIKVQKSLKL